MGALLLLSLLGCSADHTQENAARVEDSACTRYKAALYAHYHCDPAVATTPVNGAYDAYTCVDPPPNAAGAQPTVEECARYLKGLAVCDVPLSTRLRCKNGWLVLRDGQPGEVSSAGVGESCLPLAYPVDGYVEDKRYVNFTAADCETNTCIVDHLSGLPPAYCSRHQGVRCASESEAEGRMYCTCRCDAPTADVTCVCPNGFRCEQALEAGHPSAQVGSYCVKSLEY